ncbi:MAG TPA: hypothetical protein VMV35_05735 [Halothiobacillus sp.]|nr:hypothetical protein [Halothiobacillus sp.]
MELLGFDRRFALLVQECHLTKNMLLSGFDLLLKANLYQERDGYFYSAFFSISIGMERLLKLALVTHHMLTNEYQTPTIRILRDEFGHKLKKLYSDASKVIPLYAATNAPNSILQLCEDDASILHFFHEFALDSRYFNLNEVCEGKMIRSPTSQWLELGQNIYRRYIPSQFRERAALKVIYGMDRARKISS